MKNIWIFNHYGCTPSTGSLLRHYSFGKYLIEMGHACTVFASNQLHYINNTVPIENGKYINKNDEGVPFVFVKTSPYKGNKLSRIFNMLSFYNNIFPVSSKYAKQDGNPDIILASSVHPLTCVAGIKIAQKFDIPCVVEIRDLWPESIVAYNGASKNNPVISALYRLEKWIYKKADKLIFTMEGGADYIREKGWENAVDLKKVCHLNNGVDLEEFDNSAIRHKLSDPELIDDTSFKIVYTGSVRFVNDLKAIVDAAAIVLRKAQKRIVFLIYGVGDQLDSLRSYAKDNGVSNIFFKGHVDKKYVPFILKNSDISLIHVKNTPISRFGFSLNKQFDYFAAGKPILSDLMCNYDLVKKFDCGVVIDDQSPEAIADAVIQMASLLEEEYQEYCNNARNAANYYDYRAMTKKLIDIVRDVLPTTNDA